MKDQDKPTDEQIQKELDVAEYPIEIPNPDEIVEPANLTLAGHTDTVRVPVKTRMLLDGGGFQEIKWAITVKRCEIPEHNAYMKAVSDGRMTDFQVVRAVTVDWHLLRDINKKLISYTPENLMGVMLVPEYKSSITDAVYNVMSGGAKAKLFG